MESLSSSSLGFGYPYFDYFNLLIIRPVLAILFVVSLICLGWFLAWKVVLVHVPLVQEIFGLRKKPVRPKPLTRRLSKFYTTINARNSASGNDKLELERASFLRYAWNMKKFFDGWEDCNYCE